MIWGLVLKDGRKYRQEVNIPYHISMAALETDEPSQGTVSVRVESNKTEFLLANLQHGKILNQPLDINIDNGQTVVYYLKGKGVVHLTGYLIQDPYINDSSDYESDEVQPEVMEWSDLAAADNSIADQHKRIQTRGGDVSSGEFAARCEGPSFRVWEDPDPTTSTSTASLDTPGSPSRGAGEQASSHAADIEWCPPEAHPGPTKESQDSECMSETPLSSRSPTSRLLAMMRVPRRMVRKRLFHDEDGCSVGVEMPLRQRQSDNHRKNSKNPGLSKMR